MARLEDRIKWQEGAIKMTESIIKNGNLDSEQLIKYTAKLSEENDQLNDAKRSQALLASSFADSIQTLTSLSSNTTLSDNLQIGLETLNKQLMNVGGQIASGLDTGFTNLNKEHRHGLETQIRAISTEIAKPADKRSTDLNTMISTLSKGLEKHQFIGETKSKDNEFDQLLKQRAKESKTIGRLFDQLRSEDTLGDAPARYLGKFFNKGKFDSKGVTSEIEKRGISANRILTDKEITEFKKIWKEGPGDIGSAKGWQSFENFFNQLKANPTGPNLQFNNNVPNANSVTAKEQASVDVQTKISENSEKLLTALEMSNAKLSNIQIALNSGNSTSSKVLQSVRNA
jgi:hypothetical protein